MTKKSQQGDDIEEMRETFAALDSDGDGSIPLEDIGRVIRSLGYYPTEAQIQEMIDTSMKSDEEGDGRIRFPEFLSLYTSYKKLHPKREEDRDAMISAFSFFDEDGDGFISAKTLLRIMSDIGETLTPQECKEMIEEADVNGDGNINYKDFIKMLTNT